MALYQLKNGIGSVMAKKRSMLAPSTKQNKNIDELLSHPATELIEINSPIREGVKIKLRYEEFSGEDILTKTQVLIGNERNQNWLNEVSLAPLINAFEEAKGQTEHAIGIKEPDGTVTIISGSRRRLAAYYAGYPYKVLCSEDFTEEEALILSRVENVKSSISLIEHGEKWHKYHAEGMSYRDISTLIEGGKKSHTIIKAGVDGFKLPNEIKSLYPSLNCIGRPTINKLTTALSLKDYEHVVAHINEYHHSLVSDLAIEYAVNPKIRCEKLTKAIVSFCITKNKKPIAWPSSISLFAGSEGELKSIEFKEPLSNEQQVKLQAFLQTILT